MNKVLSRAEIEVMFPDEWILMLNPEPGTGLNCRGLVVAHDKDKAAVVTKAKELPSGQHIAVFYTGPVVPVGMKGLF